MGLRSPPRPHARTSHRPYAVYVHIPFCRMLCTYCDFVKYRGMEDWYDRYVAALLTEAAYWGDERQASQAVSLFFGGGTPSVLGPARLGRLRSELAALFQLAASAEVCLEANPEDVNADLAQGIAAAGFSRVSLGMQTFDDALLRRLGRLHTGVQAEEAARLLLEAGIPSVGGDLMYGLPGQTLDTWAGTLERALALGLPHLSPYGLTLEPATPLARQVRRGRAQVPDDDGAADMYDHACRRLAAAGYRHYEVSNWARSGHESQHNGLYWHGDDYIGLGAGAVGCIARRRWWNQRRVEGYCAAIERGDVAAVEEERLGPAERVNELVLLALRTAEGLDLTRFRQETGWSLEERAGAAIDAGLDEGWLLVEGGRLTVPEARWGILHSVVARLLAELA